MISAERTIDAPVERVFAFLARLSNHWELHRALVAVETRSERSAQVRLQGPFGIARDAETEVVEVVEPSQLRGRAVVGATIARVAWDLEPVAGGTRVRLSTTIERARLGDSLLLALGGRWWLRRVYRQALASLERVVA